MDENKKNKHKQEVEKRKITAKRLEINEKEQLLQSKQQAHKETMIVMAIFCAFCLPFFALVIVQFLHCKFSVFNIAPFIIVLGIIIGPFVKTKKDKSIHVTGRYNKSKINSTALADDVEMVDKVTNELKDKWKISNANQPNVNPKDAQKRSTKLKLGVKICSGIFALVLAGLSIFSYNSLVLNITKGSQIYDAEVVSVIDETTEDSYYDADNETWIYEEDAKCRVTFKYFDGTQYLTVEKVFYGISNMPDKNVKIYIKNGKVLGTEYVVKAGKFVTIYLLIMSLVVLCYMFVSVKNILILILGTLFSSAGLLIYIILKVSAKTVIYTPVSALIVMLACIGWFFLIYGLIEEIGKTIKDKKAQNRIENN